MANMEKLGKILLFITTKSTISYFHNHNSEQQIKHIDMLFQS